MVDSARAGTGQAGEDGKEQGDAGRCPAGSEEASDCRGVVTEADIGMAEEEGRQDIAREDI